MQRHCSSVLAMASRCSCASSIRHRTRGMHMLSTALRSSVAARSLWLHSSSSSSSSPLQTATHHHSLHRSSFPLLLSSRSPVRSFTSNASSTSTSTSTPTSTPRFKRLQDDDLHVFRSILGNEAVLIDDDTIALHSIDWMKKYVGRASCVLKPVTTQQVSQILAHCYQQRLAVVPQSGNTGLVGGSVPIADEIVLSLTRMNQIESFHESSGIVVCQSGVILESLSQYLANRGFIVPLDLGAKGSCLIGGNVSTNAGGLRLMRYGSLHGSVLGLEVVQADGTILNLMSTLRKDNTGFDLKQLFIGSEGALGIVTKVSILASRKPSSVQVAVLGLSSFDHVIAALMQAKSSLCEIVSAIEFFDRSALELVLRHIPYARDPFGQQQHKFYMLIETHGSNQQHDSEKMTAFLEAVVSAGCVEDGVVAQDETQQAAFWRLREPIADAVAKEAKAVYRYDVSIPVAGFYTMVEEVRARVSAFPQAKAGVIGYGHLGDGNLHVDIHSPQFDETLYRTLEPWLFERVHALRGSISAEHGIGQAKPQYMHFSRSPEAIALMRDLKHLLDDRGILNPNKVLPPLAVDT